jgi:hypothetical protein
MTSKEAKLYFEDNAVTLETQYLIDAGYTTGQAAAFIAMEEKFAL